METFYEPRDIRQKGRNFPGRAELYSQVSATGYRLLATDNRQPTTGYWLLEQGFLQ